MARILRFKGFSDPIHESEIFSNSPPDPDWGVVRFYESVESINCGYYLLLMKLWLLYLWEFDHEKKRHFF